MVRQLGEAGVNWTESSISWKRYNAASPLTKIIKIPAWTTLVRKNLQTLNFSYSEENVNFEVRFIKQKSAKHRLALLYQGWEYF